ncbi:hypothetical protein AJ80_09969 [Polytolypa hystricis UAMH7299]|uniref:Uncharacterized protein n=1 Tax=Polytolypa hystricis (strain UAMH7299) TaxID=1447883 RepID=A0A2B7WFL2_POLH7|nr:hypothetical protein AJ80_09969 [Polytolypa hystricis UAMH7299]
MAPKRPPPSPSPSSSSPTSPLSPSRSPISKPAHKTHKPHHHRKNHHPLLPAILTHLSHPLTPLISLTTGLPHPLFPRTILSYHLLDHTALDTLAAYYHQTVPATRETGMYPAPISGGRRAWVDGWGRDVSKKGLGLEVKRRRWGRFMGLRGCESPVDEGEGKEEEDVKRGMEREWEKAMERARRDGGSGGGLGKGAW